jgi:hypothetical protein
MATQLYDFILTVINNVELTKVFNTYIETLNKLDKKDALKTYRLLHSNNFLEIVKTLDISTSSLGDFKSSIIEILATGEQSRVFLVYSSIVGLVNRLLEREDRTRNSSIAYTTAKNVEISEYVESLGTKSFTSIVKNFTNFSGFTKDSASYSIVFTAHLEEQSIPTRFYFKLFPIGQVRKYSGKIGSYDTAGLEFELKAYEQVFKLAKYNITPNILCKVATGTFTNFDEEFFSSSKLSLEFREILLKELVKINAMQDVAELEYEIRRDDLGVSYDTPLWKSTGVLITNPGGEVLREAIMDVTALERKQIMFQLLYNLYIFEKLQISHGDLHSGNVFVIDVEPTQMCFRVEGLDYCFTTTKLVKIYDFDFGNISRDTKIKLNTKSSFKINRILNPNRHAGKYLNVNYGLSEYFNKQLDLCVLYFLGFRFNSSTRPSDLKFFGDMDPILDSFIKECCPGFDKDTPIANSSIKSTLMDSLASETARKEASIVFNTKISGPGDLKKLQIGQEVLDMTWHTYLKEAIIPNSGRLLKQLIDRKDNNQLWIPDSVVIPKVQMLHHRYFEELRGSIPTNVRMAPIYTLHGIL